MLSFSQLGIIRGSIKHVDYTKPDGVHITIMNDGTGELIEARTSDYIRHQKLFWVENGESLIPPPLHVTDVWVEDNVIYFTTSEPVRDIVIWLREYRWDGFETSGITPDHDYWQWASQSMSNSAGYVTTHAYGIPRSFLGINWSWNLVIEIQNQKGETAESEMIRFKTNDRGYQEIIDAGGSPINKQ